MRPSVTSADIAQVFRAQSGRSVATLVRLFGDDRLRRESSRLDRHAQAATSSWL